MRKFVDIAIKLRPEINHDNFKKVSDFLMQFIGCGMPFDCHINTLAGVTDGDSDTGYRLPFVEQYLFSVDKMSIFVYHLYNYPLLVAFYGNKRGERITTKLNKLLAGLKIENWYHVFIILGACGAITTLVFDIKGIANIHAFLLFAGLFMIGIGEWINHPLHTRIVRPNVYTPGGGIITGHPRKNVFLGVLFVLGGIAFCAVAVYKILKSS